MTEKPLGLPEYDFPLYNALSTEISRHVSLRGGVKPSRYVVSPETYAALKDEGAAFNTMSRETMAVFGVRIVPEAPKP